MDAVLYDRDPPWAWLSLNRPEVHNAFDVTLRDGLFQALATAEADPAIQAVCIMGRGPSFGTGGDLREFSLDPEPWRNKRVRRERDVWARLLHHRCLTVALVHGHVAGSGLELAMYCGLRLAAPDSRWLLPETGVGLIPGAGGTQLLPRLTRPGRALGMMLLGEPITGARAHHWGLAQALIEPDRARAPMRAPGRAWLERHVAPLLRPVADRGSGAAPEAAPALLRLGRLMRAGLDMPLPQALELESLAAGFA